MSQNVFLQDDSILVVYKPHSISFNDFTEKTRALCELDGKQVLPLYEMLDDCSGVAVYALSQEVLNDLQEQLKEQELEITFYAVTIGTPENKSGCFNAFAEFDKKLNRYNRVPKLNAGAENINLTYQVLESKNQLNLVKISTTDFNQDKIRFAMADLGMTILGDKNYGGADFIKNAPMILNLVDLRFRHPKSEQILFFRALPPENKLWTSFNYEKWFKL